MTKYDLHQKRVIVSGASSGIGRELARRLCEEYSCRVVGIGRNEERLSAFRNSLKNKELFAYKLFDVSVRENWENFAAELEKEGFIPDMVINNAGFLLPFARAEFHSAEDAENILSTNSLSCVYSFSALLPLLRRSPAPAFVNVSSASALAPVVGTALYSASKSAVKGFTECLALDYRGEIYVAGVYPGFTKTDIFSHQKRKTENTLVEKLCLPTDKAVKRILKKLKRGKTRIVTGADAKAMSFFYRLFPNLTGKAIRAVLKKSGLEIFKDVF